MCMCVLCTHIEFRNGQVSRLLLPSCTNCAPIHIRPHPRHGTPLRRESTKIENRVRPWIFNLTERDWKRSPLHTSIRVVLERRCVFQLLPTVSACSIERGYSPRIVGDGRCGPRWLATPLVSVWSRDSFMK